MPASFFPRSLNLLKSVVVAGLVALLTLVLSSGAADASVRHPRLTHAIAIAMGKRGDPYVYGAAGPNAFDCSGLTSYAYKRANRWLPRTADQQWHYVRHIPKSKLRRGDFMFFLSGGNVYHMGIFVGRSNGRAMILHASRPGTPVKIDPVWTRDWRAGTLRHRR